MYKLGREENIWSTTVESGNRWQIGGAWAVDKMGVVRWGGVAKTADDLPGLEEGCRALGY